MLLRELFYKTKRRILKEDLSKGSMTVMSKPNLVASLAEAVRDDSDMNPTYFGGLASAKKLQKMPDQEIAQWFLAQLDRMETEGYRGFVYSRDGVNNLWVVQNYIALRDTWEDITGKMQSVLFDFYALKNRSMLDANHNDLMKFKGVRDLGHYMVTHYDAKLKELRATVLKSARDKFIDKMAKAIPVVSNESYKIYMILNRYAAQKLARGAVWCTGMENTDAHFRSYTSRAALFVLFPNDAEAVSVDQGSRVIDGREKYQFDAGGPYFMNIGDRMQPAQVVRQRFPYLYDDLKTGLEANKERLEGIMDTLSQDMALSQDPDAKTLKYDVDKEIEKLGVFIQKGYMTNEQRPAQLPEPAPQEQPPAS